MTIPQASLHAIEQRVRALLECSTVIVSLASSAQTGHPLLSLCGAIQNIDDIAGLMQNASTQSLIIQPLTRPAGLLAFLVCVDTQPNRFLQGERLLLEQLAPALAQELEDMLAHAVTVDVQEGQDCHPRSALPQQTLVSLVGHDLRTPLTAIKGYAALLQAYNPAAHADMTPQLQQHYLDVILEQAQHMEVLVNDLLDVSRVQSGQRALQCTWVNIVHLCQRVLYVMQERCEQQQPDKYTLRCRFDTSSQLVWADPERVRQVLVNLIENAVKYSPNGGLIEVRVRNVLTHASITVRDWGLGIPSYQQERLFHAFERGEHIEQGFGLGLYIARTLIEAMGGSITLRSSTGNGTSVSFTLPTENTGSEFCKNLEKSVTLAKNCPVCYSEQVQMRKCL